MSAGEPDDTPHVAAVAQPPRSVDRPPGAGLTRSSAARQAHLLDLVERLVRAGVAMTARTLGEASPGLDLTLQQWRALLIVGEGTDGATVSEVASRVGVTLPATSRLLKRLALRGYMAISRDEADHRATRVRLTIDGRQVLDQILLRRRRHMADAVSTIRASNVTLSELASVADSLDVFQ